VQFERNGRLYRTITPHYHHDFEAVLALRAKAPSIVIKTIRPANLLEEIEEKGGSIIEKLKN
jgi:hypothetical protein